MKRMKKILAMALAVAMVLGMSMTTFAATPHEGDTTKVKITNLNPGATVTLYQLAKGVYGTDKETGAQGFIKYEWYTKDEAPFKNVNSPTADEINGIAKDIGSKTLVDNKGNVIAVDKDADGTIYIESKTLGEGVTEYTYTAKAGAYIAIITGGNGDKAIYNPILLTATYGKEGDKAGTLIGGEINANSTYIGTEAVAKKKTPSLDKSVTGATTDKDNNGNDVNTASVGQVLTFTLDKIDVPTYPANATNKTFFISDTMVTGLTFDYSSLRVLIDGHDSDETYVTRVDGTNKTEFKIGDKVIAEAVATTTSGTKPVDPDTGEALAGNGFNIRFIYDNLVTNETTGAIAKPIVKYEATINSTAVVKDEGSNPNTATLYYAKNPNSGTEWKDLPNKPGSDLETAKDYEFKSDTETIYTYQLAFKKTDDDKINPAAMANAIFGIYADPDCKETSLIDTVTSDANGFAVSTRVGAGTYYIKELWAPDGYTLNDNIFHMKATWTTATTTYYGSVTNREYTTDINEAAKLTTEDAPKQVGWIQNEIFYKMDKFTAESDTVKKAYIKSSSTSNTSNISTTKNNDADKEVIAMTALLDASNASVSAITNTKLTSLPSTGGIGTTIFTVGGCAIMIIAAGLYFATKKKAAR